MNDLLVVVWAHLRARRVAGVVIGASALASFGVSRSTLDITCNSPAPTTRQPAQE